MSEDLAIFATFWTWLIVAAVLAGLETLVPGAFMIWLAGASAAVGVLTLVLDLSWQLQLVAFAALSVVAVALGRSYLRRHPIETDAPTLNRRGDQLIGRIVTVSEAFRDGEGRVMVGDSPWIASGPDLPLGAAAKIVRADGSRLVVAPASE